ncbi:MAG: hypothetical protein Q9165_008454 [Trypethelium subeluteriae]
MASTTEKIGTEATLHSDQNGESRPLKWRPSRRASTFQYDPPSASSSDSDASASPRGRADASRNRTRAKKDPWYKKMRTSRGKIIKILNQTWPRLPPPDPVHTNGDEIIVVEEDHEDDQVNERVSRGRNGRAFWPSIRGRHREVVSVGQDYNDPESVRARSSHHKPSVRSRPGTLGALLGLSSRKDTRRLATGLEHEDSHSYSYYDYTDSSDSPDQEAMSKTSKMRVFYYDIEESGIRSDPGEAYFDTSKFEPDKTGRERERVILSSDEFRMMDLLTLNSFCFGENSSKPLILIQNEENAMADLMRSVFSDSHWFHRYGEELISRVNSSERGEHVGPPTKKARFFRILRDEKRNMVQSAFCIDHWVTPLESDDSGQDRDDGLQQLVVYWQYQWSDGKNKQRTGGGSTAGPDLRDGNQPEPSTGTLSTSAAVPIAATNKKANKGTQATNNIGEAKEAMFHSNLIVIYERSKIKNRPRKSRKSIVLDSLTDFVPPSAFAVKEDREIYMENSKEELVSLDIVEMLKYVIERVCESLTDSLDDTINSYSTRRAGLAEKVYQKPEDDTLASKLWEYSRAFQDAGKIINLLALLVDDIRSAFGRHLNDKRLRESFLADMPNTFKNLGIDVQEELQKPTADMIDLVYKSDSDETATVGLCLRIVAPLQILYGENIVQRWRMELLVASGCDHRGLLSFRYDKLDKTAESNKNS